MSNQLFLVLCEELFQYIRIQDFENLFLWRFKLLLQCIIFSDKGRFRKTANAFGIAKNTVSMITKQVTKVISNHLVDKYIKLPQTEKEVNESCSLFFEKHDFPLCLESVDGTQIVIKWPSENSTDYISCKGSILWISKYMFGHKYCFIELSIKWPGCVHDTQVFWNSSIYTKLRNGSIPKCEKVIIQN